MKNKKKRKKYSNITFRVNYDNLLIVRLKAIQFGKNIFYY